MKNSPYNDPKGKPKPQPVRVRALLVGESFELACFTAFSVPAGHVFRVTRVDRPVIENDPNDEGIDLKLEIFAMDDCVCPDWPAHQDSECPSNHNHKRRILTKSP